MAAKVKYVKEEHAEILKEYLDSDGVALVFPECREQAQQRGLEHNQTVDYDYGGEADVFVDKVTSTDHWIFQEE